MVPKSGVEMVSEGLKRTMKKGLGASWFPRVGWKWFGNAKNEAWKRSSVLRGFWRVEWEGLEKAKNEAWKGVCVLHGSQEWGVKGLGRLKMKHEKVFGCFMVPNSGVGKVWEGSKGSQECCGMVWKAKNATWKRGCVLHGSQEWGGKGLRRFKMKHEKRFGCFMVPKSGVGRVWDGKHWSMKRGLGVSHGSQE